MPTFPRETREHLPVTVNVDGAVITAGVTFAISDSKARPVTFTAAVTVAGKIGVFIEALVPGTYNVWAKVTVGIEQPVINCGQFTIS
jgi:hypothetical protein